MDGSEVVSGHSFHEGKVSLPLTPSHSTRRTDVTVTVTRRLGRTLDPTPCRLSVVRDPRKGHDPVVKRP